MPKKLHFFLVSAFLCIIFSVRELAGEVPPPSGVRPSDSPHYPVGTVPSFPCRGWHVPQREGLPGSAISQQEIAVLPLEGTDYQLSAALCEMAAWKAGSKAERDSLLVLKANFLVEEGESARAFETICRIQRFGLSEQQNAELLRRKLIYTWEAGLMEEFRALLLEADSGALDAASPALPGKVRRHNSDTAMILSVVPGAGLAYTGEWPEACLTFLSGAATIALGAGAFCSGLYLTAFLGGGMLLSAILPRSTQVAVSASAECNQKALKDGYKSLYETLKAE